MRDIPYEPHTTNAMRQKKAKLNVNSRSVMIIGLYIAAAMSIGLAIEGLSNSQHSTGNDSSGLLTSVYAAQDNGTMALIIPVSFGPGSANGQFQSPVAVAVDRSGNIYVVDSQTAHIQVFDPTGKFLSVMGGSGSGNGQFNYPYGIAIDSSGNIYVQDNLNARIQKFDSSGKFLMAFGSAGSSTGEFRTLGGIAVDGSGNVYVVDSALDRIQKFDPNGQFKFAFGSFASNKFDPTGLISGGKFDSPRGIAIDNSGNIYVADTGNDRVQKFDSSGRFVLLFGSPGVSTGQFDTPNSVATDDAGNVYVPDSGNDRIEKFDSSGKFISSLGTAGFESGGGKFLAPTNIVVDGSGKVYVADTGNYRVQVISLSGTSVVPEFPIQVSSALVASIGFVAVLGRTYLGRK